MAGTYVSRKSAKVELGKFLWLVLRISAESDKAILDLRGPLT